MDNYLQDFSYMSPNITIKTHTPPFVETAIRVQNTQAHFSAAPKQIKYTMSLHNPHQELKQITA